MASVDLIKSCLDSIRQVSDEFLDAAVYIDSGCVEAFQLIGAFPLLLDLGARAVCSLENVSPLDATVDWRSNFLDVAKKVVVMTAHLLSDAHRYILRCLSAHQNVLHCTIFTSISELAHSTYVDSPLGPDAFREYESLLIQDYEELVQKPDKREPCLDDLTHVRKSAKGESEEKLVLEDDSLSRLSSAEHHDSVLDSSLCGRSLSERGFIIHANPRNVHIELTVSVLHFPMIFCPLSPRVFVLPSEGMIAEACLSSCGEDSLSPALPCIRTDVSSDSEDVPPGAALTAHFLYHLAAKMDLKMDIFSLGDLSRTIGKMLTDMSSLYDVGRRNKRSAGLLLIDRTLDLLTPCCHGDSLVDRMLSSLPLRERTISSSSMRSSQNLNKQSFHVKRKPLDVKLPLNKIFNEEAAVKNTQLCGTAMGFLSGWKSYEVGSDNVDTSNEVSISTSYLESRLLKGSFLSNYASANYLDALLYRGFKDGVMLIKNWLLEALQHEKVHLNIKGHLGLATTSDLCSIVRSLASNPISLIRNREIIQLALAADIALSEPHCSLWDAYVSAERILNINSGDNSQCLSSQIHDLINTSSLGRSHTNVKSLQSTNNLLSFKDTLLLTMIGYILAGEKFLTSGSASPFSWEEEHSLKESVVDAILEKPTFVCFRFLHDLQKELEAHFRKQESRNHDEVPDPTKADEFDDEWGSWDYDDTEPSTEQAYDDMQLKLELRDRVDQLFNFFHTLSGLKFRNPAFKGGLVDSRSNFVSDAHTRKGLIYKILSCILAKHDVSGLEYHSSAVGRFLKSGFGRFGLGQAKPCFGDQSVLLVFVVGGINGVEVCESVEAISESSRPEAELILGGTSFLTPDDMLDLLLGT